VTCHYAKKTKEDEPEKTDTGSNERPKPSTDELHVDGELDGSAAPVTIAGEKVQDWAAGREIYQATKRTGRLDFSAESVTLAGR
jgi:hypothetical protein